MIKAVLFDMNGIIIDDEHIHELAFRAAGCYCIGVTTTHEVDDLKTADLVVSSFDQIDGKVIKELGSEGSKLPSIKSL